jgi:hypothetical protein
MDKTNLANGAITSAWHWVHRNAVTPVTQNLFAAGAIAALVPFVAIGAMALGVCSDEIKSDVAAGEALLARSDAAAAIRIASDATSVADNCACTHALMAAAQSTMSEKARIARNPVAQEIARAQCYREAAKAKRLGDRSSRTEALTRVCKANASI